MLVNSYRPLLFVFMILSTAILTSCSKGPDVRLTLCQDLSQLLLNGSKDNIEWTEHKAIIKGYQDLEMQIHFSLTRSNGVEKKLQASCFYPYEQDDIGAETFEMPTSAYSSYPVKMLLDGQKVDSKQLAQSINKVMLMQGKQAIKNLQEKLRTIGQKKNVQQKT